MSQKHDRSLETLHNESTRQRWALFHRAIASAKQSNTQAMQQAEEAREAAVSDDTGGKEEQRGERPFSIAR